jgi:class 3 adenylate cyclase/tetratricopeptide (TPR) repeat protein
MFVDLVASAELSARHDPEDLRHMIVSFQRAAEAEIGVYEGHIAQYLGDGILVYFGFPRAHENDGQRAVLAALGIIEAVRKLNVRVLAQFGVALAVRIGVHTGPTVIGEVGSQSTRETLAIGPTPNIAARLQAIAAPNSVVISEETRQLVRDAFVMEDLGLHQLKGFAEPRRSFKVSRPATNTRFQEAILAFGRQPMFGRDAELAKLLERWTRAREGTGGALLIRGDAGAGKSRLVSAFVAHLTPESSTLLACRCSPFHSNSPLHALREMIAGYLGIEPEMVVDHQEACIMAALAAAGIDDPSALPLLAAFLGVALPEGSHAPLAITPQIRLQRTLSLLWQLLAKACELRPVIVLVEDLHWVDSSTLEFLRDLSANISEKALLVIMTSRVALDVRLSEESGEITLEPLPRAVVRKIVEHLRSGSVLAEKIIDLADGNPFFAEELTRMTLETVSSESAKWNDSTIPSTLRDLLTARLDRLPPARRTLAQLASIVGRTFSAELLAEIVEAVQSDLAGEIVRLADAEVIGAYGPPGRKTFVFKHALLQEAAYQSLPLRTRAEYHRGVAAVLERRADTEPEILAHHFTAAGQVAKAIANWQRAGEAALKAFGLGDAVRHLERGLALTPQLPDSPERVRAELALRVTLGAPIMLMKGFASPEVKAHNEILSALCNRAGAATSTDLQFAALWSLWTVYEVSGAYANAEAAGDRLLELARSSGQSIIMLAARTALGGAHLMRGRFALARTHFEAGLAVYEPKEHRRLAELFGQDCAAMCAAFLTWVHVHEGELEAGQKRRLEALAICAACDQHPGTRGFVECVLATYHNLLGQYAEAAACSESVIQLGIGQGMPHWAAQGEINLGWSLQGQGQFAEAQAKIQAGIGALLAIGSKATVTYFYSALASAELGLGRFAEALAALDNAMVCVDEGDERSYEAELRRLRAQVLLSQGRPGARQRAGQELSQALKVASNQGAHYFAARVSEDSAALAAAVRDQPSEQEEVATS